MIGMYTYGLTIGMHFSEITKVLMSPVGDTICDILDGNVFTRDREYRRVNDQVFDYFDKGPTKVYKILGDQVYMVQEQLSKVLTQNAIQHKEHSSLPTLVKTLASQENFTLQKKLEIVQQLRKTKDTDSNFFVDFFEKYICQYDKILQDKDNYDNIKTLAKGAQEMFIIGQIYSLNQGIKTDQASFINQVSNIEDVFINAGFENKVNIVKFAYDERYRQSMIRAYEDAKGTFNILDAISSNPHTLAYIKAAATALQSFKNSFKFRTVYQNILEAMETVGTQDRTSIVKGLQNYVGDYLRDNWFISRNINFVIPKGNVDQNGETLKVDTTAELGYKQDNSIFKLWVENEVIPNLKNGKIGDNIIVPIKENMFIQQLTNDLQTNNVDHNPSIVYTLPINMLPRTDEQRNIFNQYKAEFNKLAQYSYEYKTDSGVHSIPLVDLFTYYAMIANNWKQSEVSLVSILEDFQNNGIIADFHKFEDTLDKSTETLSFQEDMIPYIAPIDNPFSSKKTYIYGNSEEGRVLMRSYVNEDYSRIYSPIDIEQSTEKEIIFNVNDKSIRLNYDQRTKDIRHLGIGLNHFPKTIETLKGKVPITKKDGRIYVDIQTLQDLINNELNKC